jgi:polyphosphate kinase 2 (PPK2 family)
MTWIILEGNEKVGKSTVANFYAQKGFQVVHFSAPPKKYSQLGYSGPSYLDDLLEKLMPLSGQDVLFDRSWWGELVWPQVFGRMPLLSEEDFDLLKEIEEQNLVERYLLVDKDHKAHWQS